MVPFFVADSAFCLGIVPNVNRLAGVLRCAGGMVAWIVPGAEQRHPALAREFFGAEVAEMYRRSGSGGPPRARLWAGLDAAEADPVLEKAARSAFLPGYCGLPDLLRRRGIDTVLIAGTVTNVCCESSARDAASTGFRVVMVADANAARSDAEHNATLHTIYRSFGDVRSTNEVLALIAAG
jgi:nicotinamidase-related amidase